MTENQNTNTIEHLESAVARTESIMQEFLIAADVSAVYAEPVIHGEHMIIPAAEILSAAGFGLGTGYGSGGNKENPAESGEGGGGGGGGGGRVLSRPVAVIVASPSGVVVKPVIDITKLWIAALTTVGFIFAASRRMRRGKIG